jgi:predicted nuclease of restriction endonuclease-like RecB superfamily
MGIAVKPVPEGGVEAVVDGAFSAFIGTNRYGCDIPGIMTIIG